LAIAPGVVVNVHKLHGHDCWPYKTPVETTPTSRANAATARPNRHRLARAGSAWEFPTGEFGPEGLNPLRIDTPFIDIGFSAAKFSGR
jgi:hypothetical protein